MNRSILSLLALTALAAGPRARAAEPHETAAPAATAPDAPAASAASDETAALREQIQELRAAVQALQLKLDAAPTPASVQLAPQPGSVPVAPVSREDLDGVRSDLEQFKYQYGREREYNTAVSNRPVNLSGTVQTRLGYTSDVVQLPRGVPGNGAVATNGTKGTFANGSAALQFAGNLYKDYQRGRNLTYLLRAAAGTGGGGVNLQFASLTYNFRPTLSPEDPRLTLQLGQQILPFGLDVAAPDELKPTINTAQFASLFPNAVDIGALVRAEFGVRYDYGYSYRAPLVVLQAGVFNGSGANTADNNSNKDLFARAVFTVPAGYNSWLRQLAIGASAYRGTQNTSLNNAGAALSGKGRRDRLGVDLYYNHHPFGLTYELVRGWDVRTYGATLEQPGRQTVESQGQVLTLYYTFGEQFLYAQSALGTASTSTGRFDDYWPRSFQPFLRLDRWDPSVGKHDAAHGFPREVYTAGLNVFFAQTTKFQLNGNLLLDHNPASPTRRVQQFLGQFQFGF